MRHVSKWAHLFSSTVQVAPQTSVDRYGKPVYGTAVSYRAHISRKRQLVRTDNGQEVQSMQQVHLMASIAVQPIAQLTLSTADVGSTEEHAIHPTIVAVERRFDGAGPHHVVLHL